MLNQRWKELLSTFYIRESSWNPHKMDQMISKKVTSKYSN